MNSKLMKNSVQMAVCAGSYSTGLIVCIRPIIKYTFAHSRNDGILRYCCKKKRKENRMNMHISAVGSCN